ncbi:MAG: RNA-binding transcriptional accessory protein [Deltaproteobacteria bacterium]|nr:RNA-binding transcriptional accessory protein [Deltaproteobacteria bacterium]
MNENHINKIAEENRLTIPKVRAVSGLLEEGATIPFIARYRKEITGSLDEVIVKVIRDRLEQLKELDDRRETILKSLEKHGHLTDELKGKVEAAETLTVLEDIYLPYRPKRRTKATIAKEKGLEPLAEAIFEQNGLNPSHLAQEYIDREKGVMSTDDALSGARDIIAEKINEDEQARKVIRHFFSTKGMFISKVAKDKEKEGAKYLDYFDCEEPVDSVPSHRILAMRRGEKEDFLNLTLAPPEDEAIEILKNIFVIGEAEDSMQVKEAVHDCYKRLLSRSMETEIRLATKERADAEAIKVFADNLRQLLLASPLGAKRVLGIDPGFRTGCKVVCLDRQGKLLHHDTIYPHMSDRKTVEAGETVLDLCRKFEIEAIAVGNGTAGRETEAFIKNLKFTNKIRVVLVNESGASIYSASEAAREEFPDYDLTVRGSVSIARRLMDPLSELVKIDPKSIGVGQYQHDVDQGALKKSLDDVVVSCVNGVGVDINRASAQLLTYVSGLGSGLAKNIVVYRDKNGPFSSRDQLSNIPRLGPKAFEQSAGFLRIRNSRNPLDASAVHPESYHIVNKMAGDLNCTVTDLMKEPELKKKIVLSAYVTDKIGLPTLNDILNELAKPGLDPREEFEEFTFANGIEKITDLIPGMKLPGIVTNITAFGVFVDIGVHQDGLVHISQLADRFVKDPSKIVKVHQKVKVTVLDVDLSRNRISLSMKTGKSPSSEKKKNNRQKQIRKQQTKHKEEHQNRRKGEKVPFNNPFTDLLGKIK